MILNGLELKVYNDFIYIFIDFDRFSKKSEAFSAEFRENPQDILFGAGIEVAVMRKG